MTDYIKVKDLKKTQAISNNLDYHSTIDASVATIVATGVAQPLVGTNIHCNYIWVGADCDLSGTKTNDSAIFLGTASYQVLPIIPDDISGSYIKVDDAYSVNIKGIPPDVLRYVIFK